MIIGFLIGFAISWLIHCNPFDPAPESVRGIRKQMEIEEAKRGLLIRVFNRIEAEQAIRRLEGED